MSRCTLFFFFAILLLALVGCQNDDSAVAPANLEGSSINQTVDPVFKAQLEGEIESENEEVQPFNHNWLDITDPTVISEPGEYRVINDFSVADGSISVNAFFLGRFMAREVFFAASMFHTRDAPPGQQESGVVPPVRDPALPERQIPLLLYECRALQ